MPISLRIPAQAEAVRLLVEKTWDSLESRVKPFKAKLWPWYNGPERGYCFAVQDQPDGYWLLQAWALEGGVFDIFNDTWKVHPALLGEDIPPGPWLLPPEGASRRTGSDSSDTVAYAIALSAAFFLTGMGDQLPRTDTIQPDRVMKALGFSGEPGQNGDKTP